MTFSNPVILYVSLVIRSKPQTDLHHRTRMYVSCTGAARYQHVKSVQDTGLKDVCLRGRVNLPAASIRS
jgi:hypothetical protein